MSPLSLVVAWAENQVIGKDGKMPWHFTEDMKHFKRVTTGHAVIMGRKTHESIGMVLPGRRNIVLSRNKAYESEGCDVAHSWALALNLAREKDSDPRVIGGAEIYRMALPHVTTFHVTRVGLAVEGDTHFPYLDFTRLALREHRKGETPELTFQRYERRHT